MVNKLSPRILFVCQANNIHSQNWINLLEDSTFQVNVFSTRISQVDFGWDPSWKYKTFITIHPGKKKDMNADISFLLPGGRMGGISKLVNEKFNLEKFYLIQLINRWKPHIVHSLGLDKAGKIAQIALQNLGGSVKPKWVASSYGNDISLDLFDLDRAKNIRLILANCDGFIADCEQDRKLALANGLAQNKLVLDHSIPAPGGLDLSFFNHLRQENLLRKVILVPKAFERENHNRTLVVLEALKILGEELLQNYEIHFNMVSREVSNHLRQMPAWLQSMIQTHKRLPQIELFHLMARSRVVIAPSLIDGTPVVMLEAMAAGALPLMSPIDSIQEWITDGKNGLLAHALYPDQIAVALKRSLQDDVLFETAKHINWQIISQRADRSKIRSEIINYYQQLIPPY